MLLGNEDKTESLTSVHADTSQWLKKWRFEVILTTLMLALFAGAMWILIRPGSPLVAMGFLFDNLPLTLPVLTVVLTVLLRPHELAAFDGWLRLATPFGLGLVSFAIWAYVAGQGVDQYIVINSTRVLNKNHALLLVIISFILASFYSVVTVLAERSGLKRPWQIVQSVEFAVSAALLVLPFFLFQDKAVVEKETGRSFDTRQFTVNIPYRDASLNHFLGTSTDPLTECFTVRHVTAKSLAEAVQKARQTMDGEDLVFKAHGASSG